MLKDGNDPAKANPKPEAKRPATQNKDLRPVSAATTKTTGAKKPILPTKSATTMPKPVSKPDNMKENTKENTNK